MDKQILIKLRHYYEKNIVYIDKELSNCPRKLKTPEVVFLKGKKRGLEFAILYIDAQLIKLGGIT
jgi:hypothetical protein